MATAGGLLSAMVASAQKVWILLIERAEQKRLRLPPMQTLRWTMRVAPGIGNGTGLRMPPTCANWVLLSLLAQLRLARKLRIFLTSDPSGPTAYIWSAYRQSRRLTLPYHLSSRKLVPGGASMTKPAWWPRLT